MMLFLKEKGGIDNIIVTENNAHSHALAVAATNNQTAAYSKLADTYPSDDLRCQGAHDEQSECRTILPHSLDNECVPLLCLSASE
jgi:hypothetical protein